MYLEKSERTYHPSLDILRGIAIILVVLYHCFDSVALFRFGWMGVDLFFVLSGYLITDLLLHSRENKHYIRNFYVRRALRIFPLYYVTIFLFFKLGSVTFSQQEAGSTFGYYAHHSLWFWTFTQNWLMAFEGPPPTPYLSHFWSLAIEEQFYLFWPLLIYFIRNLQLLKKIILGLVVAAIVIRVNIWLNGEHLEAYYCNTLTRMDSLLMGCLLAVHLKQGRTVSMKFIHLAFISFSAVVVSSLFLYGNVNQKNLLFASVGYTGTACFFTALLYLLVKNESLLLPLTKKLQPIRYIGKISFGIYVYHLPIYLLLNYFIFKYLANNENLFYTQSTFISSLSIILTVLASSLSFYLLEKPILNLKRRFP